MDPVVVIVAPEDDTHALVVKHVLDKEYKTEAIIWDVSHLSTNDHMAFFPKTSKSVIDLNISGRRIECEKILSIWWRRPNISDLSKNINDKNISNFCSREYSHLLRGAFASLNVPIVNNPETEFKANFKAFQLSIAQQCGLHTPNTLITNDPNQVEKFWYQNSKNCIYKTLTPIPDRFRETRQLTSDDLPYLQTLQHAPIIVQEMIEGLDIRINMFGEKCFAAIVKSKMPEAKMDWRLDPSCKWDSYELSHDVQHQLRSFLTKIGLHYGCIDMRVQSDGKYIFLEVNPAGQFLFVEVDTEQELAKCFSHMLLHSENHISGSEHLA